MIVDCLTKRMDPTVLIRLMRTGTISLQPTVESDLAKLRKQKDRKAKKVGEQECIVSYRVHVIEQVRAEEVRLW